MGGGQPEVVYDWSGGHVGWVGVNRKWSMIGAGSCGMCGGQPEVDYEWSGGHVGYVGVNRKWSKIGSGVMLDR